MNRRMTKLIFIATSATLAVIGFSSWNNITKAQSNRSESKKRPNIVMIIADDMGYSDLRMYGGEVPTPNIEALAKTGTILTNFHAMPSCSPSRATLLSGIDNHKSGLGTMYEYLEPYQEGKPGYEGYLNNRVVSLATMLKDGGYNTYMVGKWHLGAESPYLASDRGFEQSFILLNGEANHFSEKEITPNRPPQYRSNGAVVSVPQDFYSTDFYTNKVIEYIDNRDRTSGKPFFAYTAYTSPHIPFQVAQKYIQKYLGKYDMGWDKLREQRFARQKQLGLIPANLQLPPRIPGVPAWNQLTPERQRYESKRFAIYAGMIENLDDNVGKLIDHLKQIGEYDNTLFVFSSDNGPEGVDRRATKEADEWAKKAGYDNGYENMGNPNSLISVQAGWAQVSATPFLGYKEHLSEGGTREPTFFSYPGVIKAGAKSDAFLFVRDIMPTLLDFAQVEHPGESYKGNRIFKMDGRSMQPLLEGKVSQIYGYNDPVGFELTLDSVDNALYLGDWKILKIGEPPFGDGKWKLFNLRTDPRELNDLSKQYPDRLAAMIFLYKQYEQENGVISAPAKPQASQRALPEKQTQASKR